MVTQNVVDMLKYHDAKIGLQEVPGEASLVINISNCPYHCAYCNTKILRKDVGELLTKEMLDILMDSFAGEYSCVCFMGGDIAPDMIDDLAEYIRRTRPDIKIAWYSGTESLSLFTNWENYDFIKLGPYKRELGGLDSPTTNQRFYKVEDGLIIDITKRFW